MELSKSVQLLGRTGGVDTEERRTICTTTKIKNRGDLVTMDKPGDLLETNPRIENFGGQEKLSYLIFLCSCFIFNLRFMIDTEQTVQINLF